MYVKLIDFIGIRDLSKTEISSEILMRSEGTKETQPHKRVI